MKVNYIKRYCLLMFLFAIHHTFASSHSENFGIVGDHALDGIIQNFLSSNPGNLGTLTCDALSYITQDFADSNSDGSITLAGNALDDITQNERFTQNLWRDSCEYVIDARSNKAKISDLMYAYFKNGGSKGSIKEARHDNDLIASITSILDQKPLMGKFNIVSKSMGSVYMKVIVSVDQDGHNLNHEVFDAKIFRQSFEEKKEAMSNISPQEMENKNDMF